MPLTDAQLTEMYRALVAARMAEEMITGLAKEGILRGHHSGLAHEAIGVGTGFAVRADDCVQMSYRSGLIVAIARGACSLRDAILQQFGRARHYSQLTDGPRSLPIVGLVGTWVPMAVGVAMADRYKQRDTATVTFFGDGGANEGSVHEAMNIAGARKLPIIFFLENNGFAISMPVEEATAAPNYASRCTGYGMTGDLVDGGDVLAVHGAMSRALDRARAGQGPTLIEARIDRWEPHAQGIPDLRPDRDIRQARAKDCVSRFRTVLVERGVLTDDSAGAIEDALRRDLDDALEEARRPAERKSGTLERLDADDARRQTYAR